MRSQSFWFVFYPPSGKHISLVTLLRNSSIDSFKKGVTFTPEGLFQQIFLQTSPQLTSIHSIQECRPHIDNNSEKLERQNEKSNYGNTYRPFSSLYER